MHEFSGPVINKKRGGLGRTSDINEDKIFGFVFGAVATANFELGTIYKLTQLSDAEDLLLNASYDANNSILVYNHIKRFFEYDPDGCLYIMGVAQGVTMAQMCDKANGYVYKLLTDETTERKIKVVGVVLNPDMATYVPAYTTGYDNDVLAAITKTQELCLDLASRAIFIDNVMIEGRMDPVFNSATLADFRALTNEYVSVISAQDPAILALDADFANYADVGSALGMRSVRKVSESLGSVDVANKPDGWKGTETYPLTRAASGMWLSANLSCGKKFSDLTPTDLTNLQNKGVIFAGKYEGLDGFFFNDSHTCISSDDDYAYQEDNRVFNKAARLVRQALLPIMKGEVEVDPTTGFLPPAIISYYQTKAKNKLKVMSVGKEISGDPIILISPNQDVVGSGMIELSVAYVRLGILRKLQANVGAINPAAQ